MTPILRAVLVAVPLLAAGAASAQIQTLPETSRSQGSANAINNSLATQSQSRTMQQQNQFEVNSLRNQPAPTVMPSPVTPPTAAPIR